MSFDFDLGSVLTSKTVAHDFLFFTSSEDKQRFMAKNSIIAADWTTELVADFLDIANSTISEKVKEFRLIFDKLGIYKLALQRFFPVEAVAFLSLLAKSRDGYAASRKRRHTLNYYGTYEIVTATYKHLGIEEAVDKVTEEVEDLEPEKEDMKDFAITYDPQEAQKIEPKRVVNNSLVVRIKEIEEEETSLLEQIDKLKTEYQEEMKRLLNQHKELQKEYGYLSKHV